jgi:ABC-2 type transport system ATP-binding protein
MTTVAALQDVTMRFRGHTALDGVTTGFEQDTITGLLGRNGAGKTTLMQLATGHRKPTSGRVEVFGRSPFEDEGVLEGICFVKEGQRYPDAFRVCDAIAAASWLFPHWDDELADRLLADFELPRRRTVKALSRGMNSAVGIVIGLASRAPLTLFDEPYLGLDAVARQLFYDRLLADYAEHPRTVVLSTHLIEEISDLLEHVVLIDRGRVLMDDTAERLRAGALTVTGPRPAVEAFGRDREVLHLEALGGSARAIVRVAGHADDAAARDAGLTAETTPLQRLVVELARSARTADLTPAAVEEVSR